MLRQANFSELQESLSLLELQRKLVAKCRTKFWIALLIAFVLIMLSTATKNRVVIMFTGVLVFVCFAIAARLSNKFKELKRVYNTAYKNWIISGLLKQVDAKLDFQATSGIGSHALIRSRLFDNIAGEYTTEDFVGGVLEKTWFAFAEVRVKRVKYYNDEGKKNTNFKGIFFCADFNKHFNGVTILRSKLGKEKVKPKGLSGRELVTLEKPEFNKVFGVYSTDQIEARYILTPSLMDRILDLHARTRVNMAISFVDSAVFIALPLKYNYFEAPVYKSLLQTNSINRDFDMLFSLCGIVKDLDLNTRIWTKY